MRLRQKLVDLADSVKGFFGAKKQQDNAVEKLERLKVVSPFRSPPALMLHQAFACQVAYPSAAWSAHLLFEHCMLCLSQPQSAWKP